MSIYTRALRQTAVLWTQGEVGANGRVTYSEPVEIKCRWVESAGETVTVNSRDVQSKAIVNPDRDVAVGDILFLGSLGDLSDEQKTSPEVFFEGWEVKTMARIPNLRNSPSRVWRVALL